jgi:FAD/FMN-containing dehydrogenase
MDQNNLMETLMQVRDWTSWSNRVRELVLASGFKDLPKEVSVANSWQSYPTERNVRFNETEYHLPREHALQAFREVIALVENNFPEVFIPFEFRYIKSDDIWLSPFQGRESCSIAVHRYFKEDYQPVFTAVEKIFKKYQGRPHWGKLHNMTGPELAKQYKHWNDFKELRQQLDPGGKFLNKHLKHMFEIA